MRLTLLSDRGCGETARAILEDERKKEEKKNLSRSRKKKRSRKPLFVFFFLGAPSPFRSSLSLPLSLHSKLPFFPSQTPSVAAFSPCLSPAFDEAARREMGAYLSQPVRGRNKRVKKKKRFRLHSTNQALSPRKKKREKHFLSLSVALFCLSFSLSLTTTRPHSLTQTNATPTGDEEGGGRGRPPSLALWRRVDAGKDDAMAFFFLLVHTRARELVFFPSNALGSHELMSIAI